MDISPFRRQYTKNSALKIDLPKILTVFVTKINDKISEKALTNIKKCRGIIMNFMETNVEKLIADERIIDDKK